MMETIKLLITALIMILCFILMRGFFNVAQAENRGCIWKAFPKRKPRKTYKDEKERRVMVSLENQVVMFSVYDFEKECFEIEGVDAWREVPLCYGWMKKQMKKFRKEGKK